MWCEIFSLAFLSRSHVRMRTCAHAQQRWHSNSNTPHSPHCDVTPCRNALCMSQRQHTHPRTDRHRAPTSTARRICSRVLMSTARRSSRVVTTGNATARRKALLLALPPTEVRGLLTLYLRTPTHPFTHPLPPDYATYRGTQCSLTLLLGLCFLASCGVKLPLHAAACALRSES